MKFMRLVQVGAHLVGAMVLSLSVSGCSRDHIEAINLANEGDQGVKVNVTGAIQKYEEAIRLDPTNHRIFWKLAQAYQKIEEWDKMASTLARAAQVAPTFANYHYRQGYALTRIAEAGNQDAYEEAKAPLKKCIEADANYAECYYWYGWTLLWTDDEQGAVDNMTKAIEHDPTNFPYFYPSLGEIYLTLQYYDEAEKVLKEGTRLIKPTDEASASALYGMYTLLSTVYQVRGDDAQRLAVLEKANEVGGEQHPEIAFNLGSTYAVMKPPQKEKALQLLKAFNKRNCAGTGKKKYMALCSQSNDLLQRLGGL